jgi:hypothetical protein
VFKVQWNPCSALAGVIASKEKIDSKKKMLQFRIEQAANTT